MSMFLKSGAPEMNEFILYAYPFRSRAERVLWTLKEFDYSYKVKRLDPFKGETKTEEFLMLNPSRKVPVLCHGDDVYTESLAIMEYLNDLSAKLKLIPSEPKEAFNYRKVVHYGLTEIEPYLWLAEQAGRLKELYGWPEGTYEEAIFRLKDNISSVLKWVEKGRYIADSKFTLADIYFFHLITWAKQHNIEYSSGVSEYLSLLQERPAFPSEMLSI